MYSDCDYVIKKSAWKAFNLLEISSTLSEFKAHDN